MLSSKYARDYRMDTETTDTGKVKRKMIYVGPLYRWEMEEAVLKKVRLFCLFLCLLGWGLFVGSMLFYSNLSRLIYVILPFACLFLVLFFFSAGTCNLFLAKQPMSRERKDKTVDRIKASAFMGMLFCGGAFAGETAGMMVFKEFTGMGDFLFMAATVLLFFVFLCGFAAGKHLAVSEEKNPETAKWKDR